MTAILCLLYLASYNRRKINWQKVILLFAFCNGFTFVFLNTDIWKGILVISNAIEWILSQATNPINQIFGKHNGYNIFIQGLLPLVYVNVLIGIAFHFKLIQKFIKIVSMSIAKAFDIHPIVATNVLGNMFFDQSEAILSIKCYLKDADDKIVFSSIISGMATFSTITLGMYQIGRETEYVIISIPLTALTTLLFLKILIPTKYKDIHLIYDNSLKGKNIGETIINYAHRGLQTIINIAVSLLAYMSLTNLFRNLLYLVNLDFDKILGYIFYPITWCLNIPKEEMLLAAEVLANKVVYNGFVAFSSPSYQELSYHTKAILSTMLASFGSLSSLGMLIGVFSTIAPNRVSSVTKYSLQALLYANLINIYTGALCSIFMQA